MAKRGSRIGNCGDLAHKAVATVGGSTNENAEVVLTKDYAEALQVEPYACMVRKDDPTFKRLVDGTMVRFMKSGEFERLYTKWFESPIPPRGTNLNMPMSAALKENLIARSDRPAN